MRGAASGLIQFLPFALILGIFYFLILLPMRRRQKKIEEFQGALQVVHLRIGGDGRRGGHRAR